MTVGKKDGEFRWTDVCRIPGLTFFNWQRGHSAVQALTSPIQSSRLQMLRKHLWTHRLVSSKSVTEPDNTSDSDIWWPRGMNVTQVAFERPCWSHYCRVTRRKVMAFCQETRCKTPTNTSDRHTTPDNNYNTQPWWGGRLHKHAKHFGWKARVARFQAKQVLTQPTSFTHDSVKWRRNAAVHKRCEIYKQNTKLSLMATQLWWTAVCVALGKQK